MKLPVIFSLNIPVQTMDFRRQRGFLLDGEDPPEKVGCRKESYFLEFMYVDVTREDRYISKDIEGIGRCSFPCPS